MQGTKRGRWLAALLGVLGVAGVAAAAANRLRTRSHTADKDEPADVSFMFAIHAALRRDLSRLRADAAQLDDPSGQKDGVPETVLAGWNAFRFELDNHHSAEDEDLWPILRPELSDAADMAAVDAMIDEHRHIPAAVADVDAAIHSGGELTPAVEQLATSVLDHLTHEEQAVFPLLERHLSKAQWRTFMVKERRRLPPRQRPEFLTWILDDASERDTEVVLREIPAPGRLVYQRILRPRYEAQHRWLVDRTTSAP